MRRWAVVALAMLAGCSLDPFEPTVVPRGDGGDRDGSSVLDGQVGDGATGREGDCTNGRDDDGDGRTDCADPDCAMFACVPAAPEGWLGPGYPSTTGCEAAGDATLVMGGRGLRAGDVTCETCSCGSPSGATCSAQVTPRSSTGCSGFLSDVTVASGSCVGQSAASVAAVSTSVSATCSVTSPSPPPVLTAPPHAFDERISVCWNGVGGGCGPGMVCAAPAPVGAASCVTRTGDVECPGSHPSRQVIVTAVEDERFCTDCRCNAGGSCGGTLGAYTGLCGTLIQTIGTSTSSCVTLTTPADSFQYVGAVTGATCDPAGGAAQGCVAPSEVTTVCCDAGPVCPSGRGPTMVHVEGPRDGRAYCIDTTEVTNAQYEAFLASIPDPADQPIECAGSNSSFTPDRWPRPTDRSDEPVRDVDWCDARAFCAWAGKRLCSLTDGTTVGGSDDERDPNRSEWVHACSAGDVTIVDCGVGIETVASRPCCQANGVYDLIGNVDEWTGTCSGEDCIVHRSFQCDSTSSREKHDHDSDLGFRCCADPT